MSEDSTILLDGERLGRLSFLRIPCALNVCGREDMFHPIQSIMCDRIRETRYCFGQKRTGKAYALPAIQSRPLPRMADSGTSEAS